MALTKEQKEKIIELHFKGYKSQNEIASIMHINKRFVNDVCQAYAEMQGLSLAGIGTEVAPQPTLFPGTIPNHRDQPTPQWGYPQTANSHELTYLNKRIADLEADKAELKKKYDALDLEFVKLNKDYGLLQIDHKTVETKHMYEKEMLTKEHSLTQKSGLNGFFDKAGEIADKALKNDKIGMLIGLALAKKFDVPIEGMIGPLLGGAAPGNNTGAPAIATHPLLANPEYNQSINEAYQMFAALPESELVNIHELLVLILKVPGSLAAALDIMKKHLERKQAQPA
ncbi:MAG: hypothetical protein V4538_02375 [Bacteroidota bacterium]